MYLKKLFILSFVILCLFFNNYQLLSMEELEITKKQKIEDPLLVAIENNDPNAIIKAVIDGADPNRKLIAHNPLAWALQHKNTHLIIALLVYGADSSITFDPGNITFDQFIDSLENIIEQEKQDLKFLLASRSEQFLRLARANYLSVAEKLLRDHPELITNTDHNGRTTLHLAAKFAIPEAIKLLLQYGADIDAQDNGNVTPLLKLIESSQSFAKKIEALKILLSFGPTLQYTYPVPFIDPQTGQAIIRTGRISALHIIRRSHPEIISLLIEHGADVNFKDSSGNTPLHHAVMQINFDTGFQIIKLLKEAGADPNIQNNIGRTPAQLIPFVIGNLSKSIANTLQQ